MLPATTTHPAASGNQPAPAAAPSFPAGVKDYQRRLWMAAGGSNAALWLLLLLAVRPSAEPVTLHYTIYFGVDRVGAWYQLFLVPLAGLIVLAVNAGLSATYRRREALIGLLLAGSTLVFQVLLILAVFTVV